MTIAELMSLAYSLGRLQAHAEYRGDKELLRQRKTELDEYRRAVQQQSMPKSEKRNLHKWDTAHARGYREYWEEKDSDDQS